MEDKLKYGDTKKIGLPDEINKIILGELQEVFPYIKDVKVDIESKWVLQNPITRSSDWETTKSVLNMYVDKSYEDEIRKEQSEFYDLENDKPIQGKDRELRRYIDNYYIPWLWILRYNLMPELKISLSNTHLFLDFIFI
jgi:hypothetical protein